jgi:hypothetical protein
MTKDPIASDLLPADDIWWDKGVNLISFLWRYTSVNNIR